MKNITILRGSYSRHIVYSLLIISLMIWLARFPIFAGPTNGFDLQGALVPAEEIYHGGPPRDGIPAIDNPVYIRSHSVSYLQPQDRVLGIHYKGISRAYPIKILNYHEIVNDVIDETAVLISYCPLCGSGVAFLPDSTLRARKFGVSGLLYNSDMLLYDRETESLWSQIMSQAISGPLRGEKLQRLALSNTSWQDWHTRHPDTDVLSNQTGYTRDYEKDPYPGYSLSQGLYFPVSASTQAIVRRYHPKEVVLGLEINNKFKAYPFTELSNGKQTFTDNLADKKIQVQFDSSHRSGRIFMMKNDGNPGEEIPVITTYWFAWMAFHPESLVYTAK